MASQTNFPNGTSTANLDNKTKPFTDSQVIKLPIFADTVEHVIGTTGSNIALSTFAGIVVINPGTGTTPIVNVGVSGNPTAFLTGADVSTKGVVRAVSLTDFTTVQDIVVQWGSADIVDAEVEFVIEFTKSDLDLN